MQKRKQLGYMVTAALLTLLLTGCGASSSSSKDSAMAVAETMAAAPGAPIMEEAAADTGAGPGGAVPGDAGPGGAGPGGAVFGTTPQVQNTNRKLIRTVFLTMETTEFDPLLKDLSIAIEDLGGYIESSNVSGSSILASPESRRYASLIARIPSNQLDGFLEDLGTRGNITNRSESTEDVTLQYTDIESRKKVLKVEQDRLMELLAEADSVDAVIALEARLSEIRYQLESMESQLRTYDNQVDYSTVHIDLEEVKVFTSTSPDSIGDRIQKGFSRNLKSISDGLVNFFVLLVTSLPALVVLGVAIAIIACILRMILRRNARRIQSMTPKKEAEKEEAK